MFDQGVKDSLYRDKDMIMKVTPEFINSKDTEGLSSAIQ